MVDGGDGGEFRRWDLRGGEREEERARLRCLDREDSGPCRVRVNCFLSLSLCEVLVVASSDGDRRLWCRVLLF